MMYFMAFFLMLMICMKKQYVKLLYITIYHWSPIYRYRMIMDELKDLPRPFVIEVMEKTRGMKNKEEILMLMER